MNANRHDTTCTKCGSDELLSVLITMGDGPVTFWTCARCETTGWHRAGTPLSRDAALASIPRR